MVRRWFERLLERIGLRRPPVRPAAGDDHPSNAVYPLW
jgi:hypothetical protein